MKRVLKDKNLKKEKKIVDAGRVLGFPSALFIFFFFLLIESNLQLQCHSHLHTLQLKIRRKKKDFRCWLRFCCSVRSIPPRGVRIKYWRQFFVWKIIIWLLFPFPLICVGLGKEKSNPDVCRSAGCFSLRKLGALYCLWILCTGLQIESRSQGPYFPNFWILMNAPPDSFR